MFENSSNFIIDGGTFINVSGQTGVTRLFDYTIPDAAHDSYLTDSKASCFPGTRTQYLQDITACMTSVSQERQQRLLWMWGPPGVGKSAIAKSCAKEIAAHGMLGASFFFSRDNGVVDPARFFTTIAHQLSTQLYRYKAILDAKIQNDPALLTKGLEAQLYELILAPLLELKRQGMHIPQRAVFVDGLDECNNENAQSEIVKAVARSIGKYGSSVPLLWAFFSRPERQISDAFSQESIPCPCWQIELPVSREIGEEIRIYLQGTLRLRRLQNASNPASDGSTWPSVADLNKLVKIVAGLFIYAANIARFVMDPNAFSPQRQLQEVLSSHSKLQMRSAQLSDTSNVTLELDAFYTLIMKRIPVAHLPVVQRILLIHTKVASPDSVAPYSRYSWLTSHRDEPPPIWLPAIILGITLEELENSLSMLCSVLTLRTRDRHHFNTEDAENDQWPGSTRIFFYHASFLEFLCDRQRSMEYWILDQRHYSDISLKALRLLNEMYTMNHIPRGEKLQKLSRLLSVFPDKTFSRAQRFKFRNKLFYDFLCRYTLREWCAGSDLGPEILGELREAKLVDLERPEMESGDEVKKNLPHDIAQCLHKEANNYWSLPVPHYSSERNFRAKYPDASADVQKIWTFVESVLFSPYYPGSDVISKLKHLIRRVCKNSECSQYIQSQMTKRFSSYIQEIVNVAKEQKFETMNDFTLLSYYAFAWYRYEKNTNFCELVYDIPETITRSALLPWDDFFLLIQGDGDRLGQAALRLIKRQRDGDLFPIEPLRCSGDEHKILEALCRSLGYMSANDIGSGLQCEERLKVKLLQDTQTRYTAERLSLSDCAFLSYLENVFDLIMEENSNGRTLGYYWSPWFNESTRACAESLMEDRWSEMYTLFGELLNTDEDKNVHLQRIVQVAGWSPDGQKGLKAVFRAYVKQNVLAVILEAADDAVSPHLKDLGVCASAFLAIKQQEKVKAERIGPSGPFFHNWGLFRSSVDEALAEVLNEYPQLHEPVRELQVQQEARAKAKEEKEDILQQKSESETKEDQLQEPLVTNTEGSKPELSQDTTSPETDRGPRNRDRIRTFFQGHFKRGG